MAGKDQKSKMQAVVRSPLVTVKWLKDLISSGAKNYRILDASYHLPMTGRKAGPEYQETHIPGALFFDIDGCADKSTDLPHMIPSPKEFEDYVGGLGISNDTHVIVYDNHPRLTLFSAQRAWWTFRLFGHNEVSILEGGLPKWTSEGGEVTKDIPTVPVAKFTAKFNANLVKSYDDIKKNLDKPAFAVVDARPAGRYEGKEPEPRDDTKPGCIPKCQNLPFMQTMNLDDRTIKSNEEIKELFNKIGVDLKSPLVVTCGSGISACMLALAAYLCGKEDVAVYDGSWTEWYKKAPADLKLNVPA